MNTSKIEKFLMPVVEFIDNQKHLQAVKDGMIAVVPILIVGSFSIMPIGIMNLLNTIPGNIGFIKAISDFIGNNLGIITMPSTFTSGLISLFAAYFIAYSLAGKYDLKSPSFVAITAVIMHIIISATAISGATLDGSELSSILSVKFLGAEGLFTSIITALVAVEITRFMVAKKMTIRLPENVPPMVGASFNSLIPMTVIVIIATLVNALVGSLSGGLLLPEVILSVLGPSLSSMDTLPAMLLIVFLTQLFWFFGLHGAAITSAIWVPFAIQYGSANIEAVKAGAEATHFFTFGFYYSLLQVTGSGLTLGLVVMMIFSKVRSYSSMAKVSLLPSIFGINEPVIFGLPIVLNPIMFIPFVFGPLLVTMTSYFAMAWNIVGMPIAEPPSFMPPGVGAFIMTLDWRSIVLVAFNLIMMAAIYYPFFRMLEKKELQKEANNL